MKQDPSHEDERYMNYALVLAEQAFDEGEVPVGAVVIKDGAVIGRGYNQVEKTGNPTAHAEMLAIREATHRLANWRLAGCTLYVTKEPCPMCAGAMVLSRIDRLVYGAVDAKMGYAGTLHNTVQDACLNHHVDVVAGVSADRAKNLLQGFFSKLRERSRTSFRDIE